MIEAGLPKGVCNIVFGRGPSAGSALVAHPGFYLVTRLLLPLILLDVAGISFTGSTATGEFITRAAAPTHKKLSLELGNPKLTFYCHFRFLHC